MNDTPKVDLGKLAPLLLVAVLFFTGKLNLGSIVNPVTPTPGPVTPVTPTPGDLLGLGPAIKQAMPGTKGAEDAAYVAAMFGAAADRIEADGRLPTPLLTNWSGVEIYFDRLMQLMTAGTKRGPYPALATAIGPTIKTQLPPNFPALDATQRAKAVGLFRNIQGGFAAASK